MLNATVITNPNLSVYQALFRYNIPYMLDWIDMANATDISGYFAETSFDRNSLANWDTSRVTNMAALFAWSPFNQPLGNWDVSYVTDMSDMFWASDYNYPLATWNTANVTSMAGMFHYTTTITHLVSGTLQT